MYDIYDLCEVRLKSPDDFLKIAETLKRIGMISNSNMLVQTCHLFHKQNKYYICHFKEMLALDDKLKSDLLDEDIQRRNFVVDLLASWNMVEPVFPIGTQKKDLKIVKHSDKYRYRMRSLYTFDRRDNT